MALQFTDIGDDVANILSAKAVLWLNVPEGPVVRSNTQSDRALKAFVAVMAGLVNLVNKGRSGPVDPGPVWTVAGDTPRVKCLFSDLRFW